MTVENNQSSSLKFQLPDGYKQTEVGVIPEDWEVKTLSDEIEKLQAGVSVNSVDEDKQTQAQDHFIPRTSAVTNGIFKPNECKRLLAADIARAKLNPKANSIIISRMNTPELVGECGYVDKDYLSLFLPDRLWQTSLYKSQLSVKWLSYLLITTYFKRRIKNSAIGTSGRIKTFQRMPCYPYEYLSISHRTASHRRGLDRSSVSTSSAH